MKSLTLLIAAIVLNLLSYSTQAQGNLQVLKPGDPITIELKVPAEDAANVTGPTTVSAQGTIKLAYLDREISAAGLRTDDLARRIEQAYKSAQIYTNPTINVKTPTPNEIAPHIVTVGGEVGTKGKEVPLRDGMTLYQAIMSAGGFTEFADTKHVKLIRRGKETIINMKEKGAVGANTTMLMDGDVVHVPQD